MGEGNGWYPSLGVDVRVTPKGDGPSWVGVVAGHPTEDQHSWLVCRVGWDAKVHVAWMPEWVPADCLHPRVEGPTDRVNPETSLLSAAECRDVDTAVRSAPDSTQRQGSPLSLAELPVGSVLCVLSVSGTWRNCTVAQHLDKKRALMGYSADTLKVHYEGFAAKHDEWIDLSEDAERVDYTGRQLSVQPVDPSVPEALTDVQPPPPSPQPAGDADQSVELEVGESDRQKSPSPVFRSPESSPDWESTEFAAEPVPDIAQGMPSLEGEQAREAGQRHDAGDFAIGSVIRVLSSSEKWRECTVVQYDVSGAMLKVHYEGFSEKHDEWIDMEAHSGRVKQGADNSEVPHVTPLVQRLLCPDAVALLMNPAQRTDSRASRSNSRNGDLQEHLDSRCVESAREELRAARQAGHARTSFNSRWGRLMIRRAAILGRGTTNLEWVNADFSGILPKLRAVFLSPKQGNWLEALCPRHRVGKNLEAYYYDWATCDTLQSFFYWLDYGEGQHHENSWSRRSKLKTETIEYCDDAQRGRYAVTMDEGLLYYPGASEPIHQPGSSMMHVMGTDLTWYIAPKIAKQFHHSSFLAGGVVVAAGMVTVHHGIVRKVNMSSGHYRPNAEDLRKMVSVVEQHLGVDMSSCDVVTDKSDVVQKEKTAKYGQDYWNLF